MPEIVQTTFLGASILNYSTVIGYNGQGSTQVAVRLAEDPRNSDDFDPPDIGSPVTFSFGDFTYRGLLQHWEKVNDSQGEVYDVVVTDCGEILDGSIIILNSYTGSTTNMKNLINVFGYLESGGFGTSGSNDGGLYYSFVANAINQIVNLSAAPTYGGKLVFKGYEYKIDLSQLPLPPSFYRVGGDTSITFMNMISQVCFDGGFDYHLSLTEDNTITVRTISRNYTPSLTKIQQFVDTHSANVISKSIGRELRNEVTSAFLLGADEERIHTTTNVIGYDTIWPYWGLDANQHVIIGVGYGDEHTADLNSQHLSEIVGGNTYTCSVLEMRFALINETAWLMYIQKNKPSFATFLGITSKYNTNTSRTKLFESDLINNSGASAAIAAQMYDSDHQNKIYQVYEFVRTYATEFYGKKWMVRIPFVSRKIESDTLRVIYSEEPTGAGWIAESASPLGLTGEAGELFKDPEDRYLPFMRYLDISNADLSTTRLGSDSIILDNTLYMRCEQQPKLVFAGSIPCVVCELPHAIYRKGTTPAGDTDIIAQLFSETQPTISKILRNRTAGFFEVAVHPAAIGPDAAAVALKSNTSCYGPWYKIGPPGKIEYRRDIGLAPWHYGGYGTLNVVAQAMIENIVTNMQEGETGFVELAGAPLLSIGDALIEGGPNVTSLEVSIGPDGIKTTYRMRTFTPRFGGYNKQAIERLRRILIGQQERKVETRRILAEALSKLAPPPKGSAVDYFKFKLKEVRPHSPHTVISAIVEDNDSFPRTKISSLTNGECLFNSNCDDEDLYKNTAYMGLEGLFRPFSTNTSFDGLMPHTEAPSGVTGGLLATSLNPFPGSDIDIYSAGTSFTFSNYGGSATDARLLALRGPLMVAGWGYGIDGSNPTTIAGTGTYLLDQRTWRCGPVDLLWDDRRKVWTNNTLIPAQTANTFSGEGSTNKIKLYESESTVGTQLYDAMQWHNGSLASGLKILVQYSPVFNKFLITSANC